MKNKKKITGYEVGIVFSIIGIVASVMVIIINLVKGESAAVGIGLLCFCFLNLLINVRDKRNSK